VVGENDQLLWVAGDKIAPGLLPGDPPGLQYPTDAGFLKRAC